MSKLSYDNHRFPYAPGLSLLMTLCAIPATMSLSQAQGAEKGVGCGVGCLEGEAEEQTPNSPTIQPPNPLFPPSLNQPPKNAAPPLPNGPTTQPPGSPTSPLPNLPTFTITYLGEMKSQADGTISAEGVEVNYAGIVLSADKLEGNINRELIFSGHAKITTGNSTAYADTIHFFPKDRSYRLDNPRGVLSPELLQNRLIDPVFVRGGELLGNRDGYTLAEHCLATTCIEEHPHYQLRIGSAELFPHKRLILKRVTVVMFGQKLLVLPSLVVPLDKDFRRPRTDYLPEFGQNFNEGYYARFPYSFAIGADAASYLRLDLTQKRGVGYRIEQEYLAGKQPSAFNTSGAANEGGFNFTGGGNGSFTTAYGYGNLNSRLPRLGTGLGPQNGGLFSMQGYLADGFSRNFNASYRHQQGIGSNNRIGIVTELQRNSFYADSFSGGQTGFNSRFNFSHADGNHGVNADFSLGLNTSSSSGFNSKQLTSNLRQSFDFDSKGSTRNSFSYNLDLSRYSNSSTGTSGGFSSQTMRLDSQIQFQHSSRDYLLQFQANRNIPIGTQSDTHAFGTLERFPELNVSTDTYNFRGGWLSKIPAHFDFGIGRYSEPGSNTQTERVLLGLNLQETPILKGRTEITTGGGFEQRLYGDGAAQYVLRNTSRLRQHLLGRSGFDLSYQYEEPAGGTPFLFDTYSHAHYITAEAGYLDDSHFQLTARVGRDFLGTSFGRPWQTLSARMMWRPNPSVRFDSTTTYDPNTKRFFSLTNSLRFRARNDFAFDLLTRYDPQLKKFSQINSQFDIPLNRHWRVAGLLRYNGLSHRLESTNIQILHSWDCMEAGLTYSATPFGFQPERQIFFTLRFKALPMSRSFGRGSAGEGLGAGLGDLY